MLKQWIKRFIRLIPIAIVALILFILGTYAWISHTAKNQITDDVSQIQPHRAAVVLGTSKRVVGGNLNLFFKYRMDAVKELFVHHKIDYIIVSGDNSIMEYNETRDMKQYLIKIGIPEDKIIEDFAGFSTLDSVVRTKEVFGQDSIIIVSQPFHNERAVFIANHYDIQAVGFNAKAVGRRYSVKTHIREYLARVKCMVDVYLLHRMPKYYKEKEKFPE